MITDLLLDEVQVPQSAPPEVKLRWGKRLLSIQNQLRWVLLQDLWYQLHPLHDGGITGVEELHVQPPSGGGEKKKAFLHDSRKWRRRSIIVRREEGPFSIYILVWNCGLVSAGTSQKAQMWLARPLHLSNRQQWRRISKYYILYTMSSSTRRSASSQRAARRAFPR